MAIYVDPTAVIIGEVELEDGVSVWPYAVLRGDQERIVVGEGTNVQDSAVLHVGPGRPTVIGKDCSIGHGAVINGAIIGDRCIIGMNSSILDGADVGEECIIGANAVVTSKMSVPPRSVVVGVPGRIVRSNDQTTGERALTNARVYQKLRDEYLAGQHKRRTVP
ncbi:MAG: gamma carbonic anhydrase family protein [Methanomassiliicoccales archaeon]|nr:gamma carbonic anhydrase family protein [Methanomassiliicoccales archaeon]